MPDAFQIRAARALLDWSQDALAAASGVGKSTVKRLETAVNDPRASVVIALRRCLEDQGIVFLEDLDLEGVAITRGVALRQGSGPDQRKPTARGRPNKK